VCQLEYMRDMVFFFCEGADISDFGLENKITLDGMSEKECEDAVEKLIQQKAVGQGNV
jgi:hypothetical protein